MQNLDWTTTPEYVRFQKLSDAYWNSGSALLADLQKRNFDIFEEIFPILYSLNHSIELLLKSMIFLGTGRNVNNLRKGHDLYSLFHEARSVLKPHSANLDFIVVIACLQRGTLDPMNIDFRYPAEEYTIPNLNEGIDMLRIIRDWGHDSIKRWNEAQQGAAANP